MAPAGPLHRTAAEHYNDLVTYFFYSDHERQVQIRNTSAKIDSSILRASDCRIEIITLPIQIADVDRRARCVTLDGPHFYRP